MLKTLAKSRKMVYNCLKSGDKCNFVVISGDILTEFAIILIGRE